MKILLIGASGKLGVEVYKYFSQKYEVIGTYYSHSYDGLLYLDVTQSDMLHTLIHTQKPDVIIYTAGITDVDKCEEYKDLAFLCNAKPLEEISKYKEIKLIYISTDYVFNGEVGNYSERAIPSPKNTYGLSKLTGESATLHNPKNAVIRVSGLFSNECIMTLETRFAEDNRISSPILFFDVCKAIELILITDSSGIFHAAGEMALSRYEFAVINNAITESCQSIMPCYYQPNNGVLRPINTSLTCNKLKYLGWTRTQNYSYIDQNQLPLLIADCVGVCLTDRTWSKLTTQEQNIDNIIRTLSSLEQVIEVSEIQYGYTRKMVLSCLDGIADHYVPNPVFWNRLFELRKLFNIVIVNNGLEYIFNIWRNKYQLNSIFSLTINSEEVGIRKPDSRIFDYIMTKFDSMPGNTFLWDDDEEIVSAAVRLGIHGALFKRLNSFPLAEYSSERMNTHLQEAYTSQFLGG